MNIPRINIFLFFLTFLTTLISGSIMAGANLLSNPSEIWSGLPFSSTLMLILTFHEFGHFLYAKKHNVQATLPYFIPAPPFIVMIGTFGAFIKILSPIYRKDALLQIGASGPIAGFIIAFFALLVGLPLSSIVEKIDVSGGLILGDSLLMKGLVFIFYSDLLPSQDILLHPIAFAGWIGLLVTMLNLLPIGQLDGGHIAYAMLGKSHDLIAKIALIATISLSFLSINWLIWSILIILVMRTTKHPPINDIKVPLSKQNQLIGYICIIIFILCFIPTPIKF